MNVSKLSFQSFPLSFAFSYNPLAFCYNSPFPIIILIGQEVKPLEFTFIYYTSQASEASNLQSTKVMKVNYMHFPEIFDKTNPLC